MEEYSRIKHLDYVTAAIERMAANSFKCKSWAIALTCAVLALNKIETNILTPVIAIFALVSLWWLDAYYLRLERLFRELYNTVRLGDLSISPYDMNIKPYMDKVDSEFQIMFTKSELPVYVPTLAISLLYAIPVILPEILAVINCIFIKK